MGFGADMLAFFGHVSKDKPENMDINSLLYEVISKLQELNSILEKNKAKGDTKEIQIATRNIYSLIATIEHTFALSLPTLTEKERKPKVREIAADLNLITDPEGESKALNELGFPENINKTLRVKHAELKSLLDILLRRFG